MIKLSSLLEHILDHPMKGEAIQEAKRLESLETPRVNAERKPLLYGDGDGLYVVIDSFVHVSDCSYEREEMESVAERVASRTGKSHTVCQVIAPVDDECPTVPVATFTPERSHEWAICSAACVYRGRWYATHRRGDGYWAYDLPSKDIQRFATAAEAQDYIDTHQIADAFPWAIPKLSEK